MGNDLEERPTGMTPPPPTRRCQQQARWTAQLRQYLYGLAGLESARRVLEVGCGSGAVLADFAGWNGQVLGVDLDRPALVESRGQAGFARLQQADAEALPYAAHCFDLSLCHFLLLWVANPVATLQEMRRVTRAGGAVLALAEPDYGGRVDYPPPLDEMGRRQAQGLARQGADPLAGRKLSGWLYEAGLVDIQVGVLGGWWAEPPEEAEQALEWQTLQHDLDGLASASELENWRKIDATAWKTGQRVLYVPTFYGWGRVPG